MGCHHHGLYRRNHQSHQDDQQDQLATGHLEVGLPLLEVGGLEGEKHRNMRLDRGYVNGCEDIGWEGGRRHGGRRLVLEMVELMMEGDGGGD